MLPITIIDYVDTPTSLTRGEWHLMSVTFMVEEVQMGVTGHGDSGGQRELVTFRHQHVILMVM